MKDANPQWEEVKNSRGLSGVGFMFTGICLLIFTLLTPVSGQRDSSN